MNDKAPVVNRTKARLTLLAAAAILGASASLAGWLAYKAPGQQGPEPIPAAEPASRASPTPLPAAPAAQTGTPDAFALVSCQVRQFDESPALALTFSQPLDRTQALSGLLRVSDQGPVPVNESGEPAKPSDIRLGEEIDPSPGSPIKGNWVVGDNPRMAYFPFIQPLRGYTVDVSSKLAQAAGDPLGTDGQCELHTDAMPASYYFASRGVVLPPGQNGGLPVVTVNVPEVDVQFLRIQPAQLPRFFENVLGVRRPVAADTDTDTDGTDNSRDDENNSDDDWRYSGNRSLQGSMGLWDLDRLKSLSTSVYAGRFLADERPNRRNVTFLPVENIAELKEPGIYVAVMSQPGRFVYESQVTYFYISDIGLHSRRHPDGIDAYATSLAQGRAIAGVDMELLDATGRSLASAATDAQGRATFEGRFEAARLVTARRGQEFTVVALQQPALDLSEFDVGGLPASSNRLFVYAGRDLYRPGETFQLSVLGRNADGRALPAAPLTATLKRPDGRVVRTSTWQAQEGLPGYTQQAITLPADAPTGTWLLEVRLDPGARTPDTTWKFQVEEFLPERLKLTLDAPEGILSVDDSLAVTVQGDYLYGAPAAGNRLLSTMVVERNRFPLPADWSGFLFGDLADDNRRQRQELPETELDAEGAAHVNVPIDVEGVRSPMKIRTSFSLLESGGRPVVRSLERTVWPADSLIGLRPLFANDVTREGSLAGFEAVRVNPEGQLRPAATVQMRVFRENRQYYWRFDDQRGWNSGFTESDELVESRQLEMDGRTPLTVPVQWGRYRVELTDPDSGATMRYRFYAGWDAQDAENQGSRPDRVQIKLDPIPLPADTRSVRATITPPHDGEALVTVEGDRVLWSQRVPVKADGTTIDIPVDPAWQRHDLYVSVVAFRPGSDGEARVTPARAVGLAHLPLSREDRRLTVALDAPAKVQPERTIPVAVSVPQAAGREAWVTVSAVDVGILNITNFASPDPFGYFFGKQRYDAEMLDMYGKLIEKMTGVTGRLKWGGDAALRESRSLPPKVLLVDLFSGAVKLDAQGKATIDLALPDFNGTLRIMATVFTQDDYGNAQQEMVVAAPVVAELSMPRFISPGDAATIALDVSNLSGREQQLTVRLAADSPLHLTGGNQQVLKLAAGARQTLRYTVGAEDAWGLGALRLNVSNGATGDAAINIDRVASLQVQPAVAAEQRSERVRLAPGESFSPDPAWVAGHYPASVIASITVSNRPPFNVGRLVKGLLDYPYGCAEQTVSAAYPHVFIDASEARQWGITPRSREQRATQVAGAIGRLTGMQRSGGAFSLWGNGDQDLWLTAYITGFMQDARDAGFAVPATASDRATEFMLAQLQQAPNRFPSLPAMSRNSENGRYAQRDYELLRNSHQRFAELAYAGYVLARDQKAPLSALRALYDGFQDRARSPLPLVHMALALRAMGDEARFQAALDEAMTRPYGINPGTGSGEWLGGYGSALRDTAQAYALLAGNDIRHPRREALLGDLNGLLQGRSYLSTQEQLALWMAARAAGGNGKPWQASLDLNHKALALTSATDHTEPVTVAEIQRGVTLTAQGDEPVFVAFDVQGYPRQPAPPSSNGARIERTWYENDGSRWRGRPLQTGDTLIVHLRASADRPMDDGLIVDRVPAGFEVENMNLSQDAAMQSWEVAGKRVNDTLTDPRIRHREYRDDRYVAAVRIDNPVDVFYRVRVVTPGRFVVPAAVVEDMYRPEIRGVGTPSPALVITDPRAPGRAAGG